MTTTRTSLFLALALLASPAFAQQDISKVNGSITADAGQTLGELETVNGSIRIGAGATVAKASTVNGSISAGEKAHTGALETVNGSIRLERNVTVDGGLETVNGAIFVDRGGKVQDGVETVNGSIGVIASHVGGDVQTVRGDITIGVDSHVSGGVRVEKATGFLNTDRKRLPRIIIGPNAVVEGPLVFERPVTLHVHKSARTGPVTGATAQGFDGDTAPKD